MGRGQGYGASATSSRAVAEANGVARAAAILSARFETVPEQPQPPLPLGKLAQAQTGTWLAVFLGLDILGGPAHAADLSRFKEDAVLWAIEGHGLGHVHAASLDVP